MYLATNSELGRAPSGGSVNCDKNGITRTSPAVPSPSFPFAFPHFFRFIAALFLTPPAVGGPCEHHSHEIHFSKKQPLWNEACKLQENNHKVMCWFPQFLLGARLQSARVHGKILMSCRTWEWQWDYKWVLIWTAQKSWILRGRILCL